MVMVTTSQYHGMPLDVVKIGWPSADGAGRMPDVLEADLALQRRHDRGQQADDLAETERDDRQVVAA